MSEEEFHHSSYRVAKTHRGLLEGCWAAFLILEFKCKREALRSRELTDGCPWVCKSHITAGTSKANPEIVQPAPCKQPRLAGNNVPFSRLAGLPQK